VGHHWPFIVGTGEWPWCGCSSSRYGGPGKLSVGWGHYIDKTDVIGRN
jgi:hypothetical protein